MEERIYNIVSSKKAQRKVGFIVLGFLIFAVAMIPTKIVLAKMLPGKSANTYSIYVDTATNSTIKQTREVTECVAKIMKEEEAVKNIEIFLGQGAPLDYAGLVKGSAFKSLKNQAEIVINLTDKHERDEPSYMMVHRLRPVVQSQCEKLYKATSIKFVEMPSGPPTFATIVVNLYGKDNLLLRQTSHIVKQSFQETEGLVDIDIMQDDVYTKYEIIPNVEKIINSNLAVDQVSKILYMAFKGSVVATKNSIQQDQIPIFVSLDEKTRTLKEPTKTELELKLSRLKLLNKRGIMVPVREVIEIRETVADPTIFKKNMRNMVSVTAECDLVSQVYPLMDAREIMIKKLEKIFEVERLTGASTYMFDLALVHKQTEEKILVRWDGEMKVSLDTFRDLGGAFISALVLMFLLMVVYYKSFILSGIVLIGSFLSIIGVIIGHYITDIIFLHFITGVHFYLTATSLIGFISLMGISARSSLLLIDFTKSLIESGIEKNRAIAISTATRAKPILLTAVAIILGSLLLATDPIFGGLGIALIFGSIASTAVSLFYIPVLMAKADAICPQNGGMICKEGEGRDEAHMDVTEVPPEVHHGNPTK